MSLRSLRRLRPDIAPTVDDISSLNKVNKKKSKKNKNKSIINNNDESNSDDIDLVGEDADSEVEGTIHTLSAFDMLRDEEEDMIENVTENDNNETMADSNSFINAMESLTVASSNNKNSENNKNTNKNSKSTKKNNKNSMKSNVDMKSTRKGIKESSVQSTEELSVTVGSESLREGDSADRLMGIVSSRASTYATYLSDPTIDIEGGDTLQTNIKYFRADEELRRRFGSHSLSIDDNNTSGSSQSRGRGRGRGRPGGPHANHTARDRLTASLAKKYITVRPNFEWPRLSADIGLSMIMTNVDPITGISTFEFRHSSSYITAEAMFQRAVSSLDPSYLFRVLEMYPFHVGCLLQLSLLYMTGGEIEGGTDLLNRALYILEQSWHSLFKPMTGLCRLDASILTNRDQYQALFRQIGVVGRMGCHRTSYEYCRLLLSLDPEGDPMGVLYMIDFYALKSGIASTRAFIKLIQNYSFRSLGVLPNVAFNIALAKFRIALENQQSSDDSSTQMNEANIELQQAIIMFPMVIPKLLSKCSVDLHKSSPSFFIILDHPYMLKGCAYPSATLNHLVSLFIERSWRLWKDDALTEFIRQNVIVALKRTKDKNDSCVMNCEQIRQLVYPCSSVNDLAHVRVSDYNDSLDRIPAELMNSSSDGNGGSLAYLSGGASSTSYIPQPNSQPILTFLDSLLPWRHADGGIQLASSQQQENDPSDYDSDVDENED